MFFNKLYNFMISWINLWRFFTNHKIIVFLYFFGVVNATLSVIIQSELSSTGNVILHGNHQLYDIILIAHGLFMIFFVVILSLLVYIGWNMCCFLIKNNEIK